MRETSHVITCDPLSLTNGDRAGDKHEPWCAVQENQLYQAQMKGTSSAERKILGMPFMQADSAQRTNRCNPLIAELLRRIHMVEAWGRGMPLILRNAPDVEFREVAGIFITAYGDPEMVKTVVDNLVRNAWKFSSGNSRTEIEFAADNQEEQTVFRIRDKGAGFDMNYASKLFHPFQRLHSTSEFPGLGIGLATVQRIIKRHGGAIWAEGERGRGATFYFTLG
jgi:signal transduction histidine kinase